MPYPFYYKLKVKMYPIPGPVPAYNNPPIEPDNYQPRSFVIQDITLGPTTTVEATTDLDYVIGQLVRLLIVRVGGCVELNEKQGYVISIPAANQVTLDIYSVGLNPFVYVTGSNQSQILAIGTINTGTINANGPSQLSNEVPGSFINIS